MSGESEPDFEEEENKEANPRRPDPVKAKKPLRRSSKIIVDSVHEFEPKLSDCKSDTNCVMAYVIDNVKLLDKTYGKDLEQFEKELELLRKLITTMYHPRTSTMRGMFVKYTGIFKAYYVNPPYNETETTGEHVEIVRRVLHAPVAEVMVELNRKQERLNKRLAKKFHESYDDVVRNVREMYSYGMTNHSTKAMIRLMLACSAACGSRKGENLDPSVEFYT